MATNSVAVDRRRFAAAGWQARASADKVAASLYPFTLARKGVKGQIAVALSQIPRIFQGHAVSLFENVLQKDRAAALRSLADYAGQFKVCGMSIFAGDAETERKAKEIAAEYLHYWALVPHTAPDDWAQGLLSLASLHGLTRRDLAWIKRASGDGVRLRMTSHEWWLPKLRKMVARAWEKAARDAGRIWARKQVYCSDRAVEALVDRTRKGVGFLKAMEAYSEDGDAVPLEEIAKGSMSNPAVRRAELMTRVRGFQGCAIERGHVAVAYTLTCPSRFHATHHDGRRNEKFDGSTPREAQAYLRGVWAAVRAKWKRERLQPYGFRTAEPHHDGCPHWHLVLFMRSVDESRVTESFRQYALADSTNEAGAQKHRFEALTLSSAEGAAGYIAKYISKNIDGLQNDGDAVAGQSDEADIDMKDNALRVRAWASLHGIRQFQQVGGPAVGVWRELRRVDGPTQLDLFDGPRLAADMGIWQQFVNAQGGPERARKKQPIQVWADKVEEAGRYKETLRKLVGLTVRGFNSVYEGICPPGSVPRVFGLRTRLKEWALRRKGASSAARSASTRTRGNNCTFLLNVRTPGQFGLIWSKLTCQTSGPPVQGSGQTVFEKKETFDVFEAEWRGVFGPELAV